MDYCGLYGTTGTAYKPLGVQCRLNYLRINCLFLKKTGLRGRPVSSVQYHR